MTDEPNEVTQADREAVADFYCDWFQTGDANENVRDIRAGHRDGLPHVQAFARHRIHSTAALQAKLAAAEKMAEALEVFAKEIERLDRETDLSGRPSHQLQPLMIYLGDCNRATQALTEWKDTQ